MLRYVSDISDCSAWPSKTATHIAQAKYISAMWLQIHYANKSDWIVANAPSCSMFISRLTDWGEPGGRALITRPPSEVMPNGSPGGTNGS